MPVTSKSHRPLSSGLRITSRNPSGVPSLALGEEREVGAGTLTGVATRNSDGKQVLVTNLHVMSGFATFVDANGIKRRFLVNPVGDEIMLQGGLNTEYEVGTYLDGTAVTAVRTADTDVAMCLLKPGVKAYPRLHGLTADGRPRYISDRLRDPAAGMKLVMLGQRVGEIELEVVRLNYDVVADGITQVRAVQLRKPNGILLEETGVKPGDSGAPLFHKVSDTVYELCAIMTSAEAVEADEVSRYVYAFPAKRAADLLRITFGKRVPRAKAMSSKVTAAYGATVMLTSAASIDLDEDPLTYKWKLASSGGGPVTIENAEMAVASFLAPSQDAALTFNLTATNVTGDTNEDTVAVTVRSVEPAAPDPPPDSLVDIPLPAPSVPETWSAWLSTGYREGTCENRRRREFRTSSWGGSEQRWVADPEPVVWDETWTATDNTQGCGPTRQVEEERGNNCNDQKQTRMRAAPEALVWSGWGDTGSTRGCGAAQEKEQRSTNQCGGEKVQWVSDPVSPPPSSGWSRTGRTRGCGPTQEAEESRTDGCGENVETQWVADAKDDDFGDWGRTGNTRGCGPAVEAEERRSSPCGRSETRWVAAPEAETWGAWSKTGRQRHTGLEIVHEWSRTSNCGNTQTDWWSE